MIFSQYNIFYKEDNNTVIFNTINRQLIKIPTDLLSKYETIKMIEKLLANFLVADHNEDLNNLNYLMNSMIYQTTRLNITLMMTMNCNFKCVYCFESWIPRELHICKLDENEIINWIKKLVRKYHFKQVDICFHGGEPLLEIKKIMHIAKDLRSFFVKNNIFYLFTVVSNGYLLNREVIDILYAHDIKIIQITIDGLKEIHDKRRPLKNGGGTFEKIINNIQANEKLKIYINIIYATQNYNQIYDLIDFLVQSNMQCKIDLIILNAVKPTCSNNLSENIPLQYQEESYVRLNLLDYITKHNFKVPFDIDYQMCTLKQKSSFVLTPTKNIYKCISGVCCEAFKICKFDLDTDTFSIQANIIENQKNNTCKNCKYMPVCNGFCLYESYVQNTSKRKCNKSYFDIYIPGFLKLYMHSENKKNFILNQSSSEWSFTYYE